MVLDTCVSRYVIRCLPLTVCAFALTFTTWTSLQLHRSSKQEAALPAWKARFAPHLNTPLDTDMILTIAVDHDGSCPNKCAFVHDIFPQWVRYRYRAFKDTQDLDSIVSKDPTHILIVGRKSSVPFCGKWAVKYREQTGFSVGLMHMADETNVHTKDGYKHYDYVLRHYYFKKLGGSLDKVHVRALGNLTCGTGPSWPANMSIAENQDSPRLGIHWAFLPVGFVRPAVKSLNHHPDTVWPV